MFGGRVRKVDTQFGIGGDVFDRGVSGPFPDFVKKNKGEIGVVEEN